MARYHTHSAEQAGRANPAALYCSKASAYAQGINLLRQASEAHGWDLDLGDLARIWKGGCIIRLASQAGRDPQ